MNRRFGRINQENEPLIKRTRSRGGILGVSILAGILLLAALGLAIGALVVALSHDDLPSEHVDHGPMPDPGDKWTSRGRDQRNSANSERTSINSNNVHTLIEAFKSQIGQDPSLGGTINGAVRADINWGSATVDDKHIYLATANQRNEAGTILDPSGYIMAFDRATGARVWNRATNSYSLTGGDFEAAPAIHGDYLFIGTKDSRPQTWASPSFQSITNPTLFGFPSTGKAHRPIVYCINKNTGAEVWATEVGAVATDFASPDNLLVFAMSPIVFEMDPAGGNNKIPVVAIGTSSGNSFIPDFSGSDEATAKGYLAIQGFAGLGADPNTRMTDVGRMVLLNGNTGAIISTTMMGPPLLQAGDVLTEESVVFGDPAGPDMEIWHIVQAADIAPAGELNPIGPRYTTSKMIISIMPGATIVAGSPLVDLVVTDNVGDEHTILAGAAPANLDYVTVSMDVIFVPGTTNFTRVSPQPSATVFNTDSADLDGAAGNVPARIVKGLKIGDVLTDQDAYECNYYGASVWGSNPSINYDRHGNAVEMYVACGQAHKIPYDDIKRFTTTNPVGNGAIPSERLFNIKAAQDNFNANKNIANLQAVRDANAARNSDILYFRDNIPTSARAQRLHNNAIVAINLRPGHIGEIMWNKANVGYDTWRIGLLNYQQRQNEVPQNLTGFTDTEAHFGMLRGHDADYAESPLFCPNCGERGADIIVGMGKGGTGDVLKLSDVNNGPTVPTELQLQVLSNPGLLGGFEYGETIDIKRRRVYGTSSNEAAAFVTTVDRPFNRRSLPPPLQWFPTNENNPATIVPFTHRQSFLTCYNFNNNSVDWEVPLQTSPPGNDFATVTAISGGGDLIYVQPNSLTLQIRKKSDGSIVHTIPLDSAGVSNLQVLDREIIIANGRQGFLGDNPSGTNYKAAKFVYKFRLP